MIYIQIICRNNIYAGKKSFIYNNTHPYPRKSICNHQSIEHGIVSPNQMNQADLKNLADISRLSETDILMPRQISSMAS